MYSRALYRYSNYPEVNLLKCPPCLFYFFPHKGRGCCFPFTLTSADTAVPVCPYTRWTALTFWLLSIVNFSFTPSISDLSFYNTRERKSQLEFKPVIQHRNHIFKPSSNPQGVVVIVLTPLTGARILIYFLSSLLVLFSDFSFLCRFM